MKTTFSALCLSLLCVFSAAGQTGHEIRLNFKNNTDTTLYLARYFFGQSLIIDSCKHVKNGKAVFKGPDKLDRGVYIIANQSRQRYIDFLVNDAQKFTLTAEFPDMVPSLRSPDSKENDELFAYARFFTARNIEHQKSVEALKGKPKADSIRLAQELQHKTNTDLIAFDKKFMADHKGTFVYDFLNLKNEKYPENTPLASNGRPDSIYQYYYYKSHYFDGVDFKDERILYTPFFKDRITKYFETVIVQHPDTVIQELDKIFSKCSDNLVYQTLLGHFTYKYETDKTMSFDKTGRTNTMEKVFVHLSDHYITNGKAKGVYPDEIIEKIGARVNIIRNLLPEAKVADLFMIDTISGRKVLEMGFDTAKTSPGATKVYTMNAGKIAPLFKNLYSINAKYTILVFWSVDCGHCQKEIPKLNESLKELKGKVDFKVFAVQTKEELFDKWKKFIADHQLDFINVFEPVHINHLTDRFDINRTPVIFLLDKDKKIKGKNLSSEQLMDIIKSLETKTI